MDLVLPLHAPIELERVCQAPERLGGVRLTLKHDVPHTEFGPFPTWIGVGGNPQSVVRAARLGFSLMLAIIGGPPARFAAYSQLFQRALDKFGRPPLPVGVHSPGHVAATDEQAKAEFWPRWRDIIALIATNLRTLGATRFDLKYGLPGLTHDQLMTNIELYGHQVIPRVRELLS